MTEESKPRIFRIFFAWQSDLNRDFTTAVIERALEFAKDELEKEYGTDALDVYLDYATRDEVGSTDIAQSIQDKIAKADVFVCDISTIRPHREAVRSAHASSATNLKLGSTFTFLNWQPVINLRNVASEGDGRAVPNPNVVFELGCACAQLGWPRVIMLFNEQYGTFPGDVPFDFRHRSVLRYSCGPFDEEDETLSKNERKKLRRKALEKLSKGLSESIRAIVTEDPPRPTVVATLIGATPPAQQSDRRQRDLRTLKHLFSTVDVRVVDYLRHDGIETMPVEMLDFELDLNAVVENRLFHLYDKDAERLVLQLHDAWNRCTSYGEFFRAGASTKQRGLINYRFIRPEMDMPATDQQEQALKELEEDARDLLKSVDELLEYVRAHFDEIDIEAESKKAWNRNVRMKEELFKQVED